MTKFIIEITETLQKQIEIEADSEVEAIEKIRKEYFQSNIVLDETDFIETQFDVFVNS